MLTIPDTDWRNDAGGAQISVAFLRRVTPKTDRFTQWIQRTHAKLLQAPENVLSCCTSGLINGEIPDKNGWISVSDALALLTYSVNSSQNVPLIDAIEQKSGQRLPVSPRESRLEGQFGIKLRDLIADLRQQPRFTYFELEQQKQVGPFRVDFFITQKHCGPDGSTVKQEFIIEFDEAAHRSTRYQRNDRKRDLWLRKNLSGVKLIRVRHEEQEAWLEAVHQLKRFVSLEDCYVHCLRTACIDPSKPELQISSESARKAYDAANNECNFLLTSPRQPRNEMIKLLNRLGITHDARRKLYVKRTKLKSYGI